MAILILFRDNALKPGFYF